MPVPIEVPPSLNFSGRAVDSERHRGFSSINEGVGGELRLLRWLLTECQG